MLIEDILSIEEENRGEIHLIRDRLFWQAWERSAFLFVKLFRPYRIHSRHIVKVGGVHLWLGFPKKVLESLRTESEEAGFQWEEKSEEQILISALPQLDGFEGWREELLELHREKRVTKEEKSGEEESEQREKRVTESRRSHRELLILRYSYDFALNLQKRVSQFDRLYRYSLGQRAVEQAMDLAETAWISPEKEGVLSLLLQKLRLSLRMLKDLRQINLRQWAFLNQKIEEIVTLLQPESRRASSSGESEIESGSPLTAM